MDKSEIGRALAGMRKTHAGGRPVVLRKCPKCKVKLGARAMRDKRKHPCVT